MRGSLSPYLYKDEATCVEELLASITWDDARSSKVTTYATQLIDKIRSARRRPGELETFLQQYSLNTEEGLALMCLAEALLRIPDTKTRDALIRDKVVAANWLDAAGSSKDWVVKAAGVGLFVTSKTLDGVLTRVGEPFIREAMIKAMRILGHQFVLGRDIEEAEGKAQKYRDMGYRMSYDMLGEGARTMEDAEEHYASYHHAIGYIAARKAKDKRRKPGISVKLSALHPRYEAAKSEYALEEITHIVKRLALHAASHDIAFTLDAEESQRLELSISIIESILSDPMLKGWEDFGIAVQAYQKRSLHVIGHLAETLRANNRRMQVRLVKGAYWDTEIKRAQILGLKDYPVFTRKVNSDLSFQTCAAKLFMHPDLFYPMIGTHNAQSVAAIFEMAKESGTKFELQRLFGMGESLFDILVQEEGIPASIYAPVGRHRDLLPYLVRRLLENGANSSFVNKILSDKDPAVHLARDPVRVARDNENKRHPLIALPRDIYRDSSNQGRSNSEGQDLDDKSTSEPLLRYIKNMRFHYEAAPLIGGKIYRETMLETVVSPADSSVKCGKVWLANKALIDKAFRVAGEAFEDWSKTPVKTRALRLEKFSRLLEGSREELTGLLVHEAGKTLSDALAEVREAVDFCRYYAQRGRIDFNEAGTVLQGPTGERNVLTLHGRGVFACISPWNFPLAIFTGQIAAALMAGNTVVAKPAEQTPLIAMRVVELLHQAKIPKGAVNLLPGDGRVGASIVQHENIAGVAFTGSDETARAINRAMADRNGPIVPLIAETGGLNAMIVDSSALTEQVVDDVITSAFGSAGQRCSALRILFLQEDIADKTIEMLRGAMAQLHVGDPTALFTDIGPVIGGEAHAALVKHRSKLKGFAKKIFEVPLDESLNKEGYYFAPCAYELESIAPLKKEIFGPILHVMRYKAEELDEIIGEINNTGYGLTFGLHSRLDQRQHDITARIHTGNVYINRSMTGAVVGVQPFGGQGLSGTGPKAGGPHYLPRFTTEKVVSTDTTAQGGNASLVSLEE